MGREAKAIKSLKTYASTEMTADDVTGLVDEITGQSDRSGIVVIVSYLDDSLRRALTAKFVTDSDAVERMFELRGILGTFSSRIDMASALGMITEDEEDVLNDMRIIRNQCAHCIKPLALSNPALRGAVSRVLRHNYTDRELARMLDREIKMAFISLVMSLSRALNERARPNALAGALRRVTQPKTSPLTRALNTD